MTNTFLILEISKCFNPPQNCSKCEKPLKDKFYVPMDFQNWSEENPTHHYPECATILKEGKPL